MLGGALRGPSLRVRAKKKNLLYGEMSIHCHIAGDVIAPSRALKGMCCLLSRQYDAREGTTFLDCKTTTKNKKVEIKIVGVRSFPCRKFPGRKRAFPLFFELNNAKTI